MNLKPLNVFVPHQKFKMETLKNVKDLLQQGDLLVKIDLKHAYYSVNIAAERRKLIRFIWDGNLYEYTSLVFSLGPAPMVFTKILKVPITILRKINIRIVIYIDDLLLFANNIHEIEAGRDIVLFLLQNLGFVINWEKSHLTPTKIMEFLGVTVNSENMTFSIPETKVEKIIQIFQDVTQNPTISVRKLASLIGKLISTAEAFSPAPLQVRYLQNLLRRNMRSKTYESQLTLTPEALVEPCWWKENHSPHNAT